MERRPRRWADRFAVRTESANFSLLYFLLSPISSLNFASQNCGDRIRTCDLEVMSLASYRAAPPRDVCVIDVEQESSILTPPCRYYST